MDHQRERSRREVLAENIRGYLEKNQMQQKEAALAAGLKPTTLNSWLLGKAQPREKNLRKLADLFHVRVEDLTEDRSEAGLRRKNYMQVVEIEILKAYETDPLFHLYVEQGMAARREQRLEAANQLLEDLLRGRTAGE